MINRIVPSILLMLLSQLCFGQNYLEEVNGRPIKGSVQADVSGNPFLFKNFKSGTVLLKNGKSLKDIPLNVDLVNLMPLFAGPKNQVLAFVDPITSFSVMDTLSTGVNRQRYIMNDNNGEQGYYHVIADGNLTLLKKLWKVVWEDKTYNSATVTRTILEKYAYYVGDKDLKSLSVIKPSKKSILAEMSDKSGAIETYLKENKVNFSADEDLKKLFVYYNSL